MVIGDACKSWVEGASVLAVLIDDVEANTDGVPTVTDGALPLASEKQIWSNGAGSDCMLEHSSRFKIMLCCCILRSKRNLTPGCVIRDD